MIYNDTNNQQLNIGEQKVYIAIDLKSFYASVECVERGLDPLTTNLVVADASRTEKTICLAVSPSLKAYGIPGRARLFEVVAKLKEVNANRRLNTSSHRFEGSSHDDIELKSNPNLEISYIAAPPQMNKYMDYSTKIFNIYMKYVSSEDIHVYSVDECFIDATHYLKFYNMSARELAITMLRDVLASTGITATCGIGSNMYLAKVAMDIVAKHVAADADGVRIAELDEMTYRQKLWTHKPLTDFWRVGRGYSKKLIENGMYTMGDVARCSIGGPNDFYNEDLLYKLFGVNAELLIDHAWGYEPTTIDLIRQYKPENNSLSSGQVLQHPYSFDKGRLIVKEMTDLLVLDLVEKGLVCDQIVLTIGYDIECLSNPDIAKKYHGEITTDYYGRKVPKHAHGTANLGVFSSSTILIMDKVTELYNRIVNPDLLIRRVTIAACHVLTEHDAKDKEAASSYEQMNLFDFITETNASENTTDSTDNIIKTKEKQLEQEKRLQQAMLDIKKKYGKNAIVKGMNLEEGAMTIERNSQVGGHRA